MPDETKEETVVTPIPALDREGKELHAYIIFLSGSLVGKILLLEKGSIVMGRDHEGVDITVADAGTSRKHCRITYENNKATIEDLGSTNGTYVNGAKVKSQELQDGDKIQISSSTIFKFAIQDKIENIFHSELYKMAIIDPLTGAHNKRYFEERLKEEFSYAFRNSIPLSILIYDIDHFKKINDTYGHPAGDYVLTRLANLTRSIIRNEDIFVRYGGEEFILLMKATDEAGSGILGERLRSLVERSDFDFEGNKIKVTISLGIATLNNRNYRDSKSFVSKVDTLLYQSKAKGRNCISTSF